MTEPNNPSDQSRTSMASTKADLRELKANSSATVRELQDFLRELKGKSPQEMLGVVASSQLFRSTIISVILVAISILTLTAVPYYFGEEPQPTPEPAIIAETPTPKPSEPAPAPKATESKPLEPLGVNEQLTAPANSNPLEDKEVDFLKDLE